MPTLERDIDGQEDVALAENEREADNPVLILQHRHYSDQIRAYVHETLDVLHVAGAEQSRDLERWVDGTKVNNEDVKALREFWQLALRAQLHSGRALRSKFDSEMQAAQSAKLISAASKQRKINRFNDSGYNYKNREYWMDTEWPRMKAGLQRVAAERKQLLREPGLKLIEKNADVRLLMDEERFIDMHYDKRVDLMAKVRAMLLVEKSDKNTGAYKQLHARASSILYAAVSEGVMSSSKVGTWLERIFKSGAKADVIDRFLKGGASNSLPGLVAKWRQVREGYDDVCRKGAPLKNPAVGMYLISPERFLKMHYAQRKAWVEEADQRIRDATDIDKEEPVIIRIRHALDLKDWDDADRLIKEASSKELNERDKARLASMKRYLTQMRNDQKGKEKGKDGKPKDKLENARSVCNRISEHVATKIPSSMQSAVLRLLRSATPNRGIHQLRWIVYNNKWCRDHHFLDFERAKAGASQESSERTNERVRKGIDTGRRQDHVLNSQNSGQQFMRNNDYAKRRATLTHVDIGGGSDGVSTLTTWLEKPQHPRDLYWRTLCIHDGGTPMSEAWHNDLFAQLTVLRSMTVELEKSGFMFNGLYLPPISRN